MRYLTLHCSLTKVMPLPHKGVNPIDTLALKQGRFAIQ